MKFFIEQIAIVPADPIAAIALLEQMGAVEWHRDTVSGTAHVFSEFVPQSTADLAFNYQLSNMESPKPIEFEVLNYRQGYNWMETRPNSVSHLAMHCSEQELEQWREFFKARGIVVAQEVRTLSHTNPAIAGKRWYVYCIFDTRRILGVDLKFIVRRDQL